MSLSLNGSLFHVSHAKQNTVIAYRSLLGVHPLVVAVCNFLSIVRELTVKTYYREQIKP